jgi:hypothetical protein
MVLSLVQCLFDRTSMMMGFPLWAASSTNFLNGRSILASAPHAAEAITAPFGD